MRFTPLEEDSEDSTQSPAERQTAAARSTWVSVAVNLLLTVMQITVGIIAKSQGLIADGIHSLSDLVADFVVLFAGHHSKKDADVDHPYGHHRFETAASLALGLLGLLLLVVKGFHFENNDDVGMFCMVKGLLQFEATPHLFFQSSYLGYLYQWLYANLPAIEWYFVVYYFFILAGLVYVSYCILVGAKNIQSCFTILLLCFLASAEVLLGGLQFTKAAIWLGLAAAIGIQYYLQGNRHWHHLILHFSLCYLVCFTGILLR